MNLSGRVHKAACVTVFVGSLLFAGSSVAQGQYGGASTRSIDGLRISIHLDQTQSADSSHPKFQIELRNAGHKNLLLNLGTLVLDGRGEYPTAISLILTTPEGHRLSLVKYRKNTDAESQPFFLPLPVDSSFSIPVDLADYRAVGSNGSYELRPGTYSIVAEFIGSTRAAENFPLSPLRNPRQVPITDRRLTPITLQPFDNVVDEIFPPMSPPLQFKIPGR